MLCAAQSLSGHTSAVECVSFDSNESTVIAGSAGGTLKLWDLDQAKVARTLTGHRSNCVSVQVWMCAPHKRLRTIPLPLAHPHVGRAPEPETRVGALRAVAPVWRVLCVRLCRHQLEDLGYPTQDLHTDVQGSYKGREANRLLSRWPLGRVWRRRWCGQAVGPHHGQVGLHRTALR